jgi:chitin disaccharide deacetylase
MKNLIVTADDFGADPAVNAAVLRAHSQGILTCASLMVAAPGAREAVAMAKETPSLKVGLHLVLVEGRPSLPPADIPDLIDTDGFFRTDMAKMGADIFFRAKVRRQVAAEIEAQFKAFAETGLELDHVNAHKHYHLHPTIASLILAIGKRYGLKAMRVPYEPTDILRRIDSQTPANPLVAWWAKRLKARLRAAGIFAPDRVFGLAWSGEMTERRLCALLADLPAGSNEIYFHPALAASYPGSAPFYAYRAEADALVSQKAIELINKNDIRRMAFGAFASPP